MEALYTG
jgi:hypothetical protein